MTIRPNSISCLLVFLLCVAVESPAQVGPYQDEWNASKTEGVLLPQYCWAQMMRIEGPPEYYLPGNCGTSNHYCLALLKMVRANKVVGDIALKKKLFELAKRDVLYTLNGMKDAPQCALRSDAERTLVQIETRLKVLK
jgi:hypothetical protein